MIMIVVHKFTRKFVADIDQLIINPFTLIKSNLFLKYEILLKIICQFCESFFETGKFLSIFFEQKNWERKPPLILSSGCFPALGGPAGIRFNF